MACMKVGLREGHRYCLRVDAFPDIQHPRVLAHPFDLLHRSFRHHHEAADSRYANSWVSCGAPPLALPRAALLS